MVGWLSLGDAGDGTEPPELSVARAQLAVSQTEKTKVEIAIKQAQLGHILSGGVVPVKAARDLFDQGEILLLQAIDQMALFVPDAYEGGYLKDLEARRGPTFRLRCLIAEWKFQARDGFRKSADGESQAARIAYFIEAISGRVTHPDDTAQRFIRTLRTSRVRIPGTIRQLRRILDGRRCDGWRFHERTSAPLCPKPVQRFNVSRYTKTGT